MLKLSSTLYTFSITGSVAGFFLILYFVLMYLEHSLILLVVMRLMVNWLSKWSGVRIVMEIWMELNKLWSYKAFWQPVVVVMNSASVEEVETQACLYKVHVIALLTRQVTKLVIYLQSF